MRRLIVIIAAAVAGALVASPVEAQPAGPVTPPPLAGGDTLVERPPAPAIRSGDVVVDRNGVQVGQVKTLTEGDGGEMVVVVEIDGKLIGLPEGSLRMQGDRAVSSQSKRQMLAAAGAPATLGRGQ